MKEVRVAIIGFGGIAHSHLKGYQILASEGEPIKLVAVCDINPDQFTALVNINNATDEGEVYSPTLPKTNYMAEEIRTFAKSVLDDSYVNVNNPPESARETVRLVEKLRESAAQNGALVKNID